MISDVGIKFMIAFFQELLSLLQCMWYIVMVYIGQLVCERQKIREHWFPGSFSVFQA